AGGGAGTTASVGIAIAGSVSVNLISDDTESFLDGVTVTHAAGDVTLTADDESTMTAIGGGGGLAPLGKLGAGAGVGVNRIASTTRPDIPGPRTASTANLDGHPTPAP